MSSEIFQAIEQVGREKGIEVDIIIQAVFARKKIVDEVTNPDVEISPLDAGTLSLPANEEGIIEIPKPKEELQQLGRIAAQAAKQIIFQKVREAERDNIYKE